MDALIITAGWILTLFIGAFGFLIIWYIIKGKINLEKLISEKNGDASLSRFQFLIFTFVIATSLLIIVFGQEPPDFPNSIPDGVFILLGISGGTYVISKGIQKSYEQKK
jgi:hypothetical protein